jgi:hypothetical protein
MAEVIPFPMVKVSSFELGNLMPHIRDDLSLASAEFRLHCEGRGCMFWEGFAVGVVFGGIVYTMLILWLGSLTDERNRREETASPPPIGTEGALGELGQGEAAGSAARQDARRRSDPARWH